MTPAVAIDDAVRAVLRAHGRRATHAAAATVVGENANAWCQYVTGRRHPTTGKAQAWLAHAFQRGWLLRMEWEHGRCDVEVVAMRADVWGGS